MSDECQASTIMALSGAQVKLLSIEDMYAAEPMWKKRGATYFREAAYLCTRR